jgi:hypothetical protein
MIEINSPIILIIQVMHLKFLKNQGQRKAWHIPSPKN